MKTTITSTYLRATAVVAAATSLATVLGGIHLTNHNETVVRERIT